MATISPAETALPTTPSHTPYRAREAEAGSPSKSLLSGPSETAETLNNPDLARRLFTLLPTLGPNDDAYWYLMAPHPESKEGFADWVTNAKQRAEENYAAF